MERCPICGTEAGRTLPYKGAAQEALRFHAIALCQQCEAGFALPRPDQPTLDRFYASGSYWHAASGRAQRAHEASQAWLRVRRVRSYLGNNVAVADIGAGHGGIARAFAGMGIGVSRYVFVEPDPQAAADIAALSL